MVARIVLDRLLAELRKVTVECLDPSSDDKIPENEFVEKKTSLLCLVDLRKRITKFSNSRASFLRRQIHRLKIFLIDSILLSN